MARTAHPTIKHKPPIGVTAPSQRMPVSART